MGYQGLNIPCVENKTGNGVKWTKEELKKALKNHYSNGDGELSKEEIKKAFQYFGSNGPAYRAWRGLSHADTDKNGCVSLSDQELEELVAYAYKQGYIVHSK